MYFIFDRYFRYFLLAQKVTKKGPGKDDSPFPVGFSIKLLYYCGEEQWIIEHVYYLARHCEVRSNLILLFKMLKFIEADCFVVPPRNDGGVGPSTGLRVTRIGV